MDTKNAFPPRLKKKKKLPPALATKTLWKSDLLAVDEPKTKLLVLSRSEKINNGVDNGNISAAPMGFVEMRSICARKHEQKHRSRRRMKLLSGKSYSSLACRS